MMHTLELATVVIEIPCASTGLAQSRHIKTPPGIGGASYEQGHRKSQGQTLQVW